MISKCANPACHLAFHYLRGGRLYLFDLRHPSEPCKDMPNTICARHPSHASVYFWLCEECSLSYTLRFSAREGLSLRPMALSQCRPAAVVADVRDTGS